MYGKDKRDYHREEFMKIRDKDLIEYLQSSSAPIEYIDSMESIYCLIAKDKYSIDKDYTHEIFIHDT